MTTAAGVTYNVQFQHCWDMHTAAQPPVILVLKVHHLYLVVTKFEKPKCERCEENVRYMKEFIAKSIKVPRAKREAGVQTTPDLSKQIKLSGRLEHLGRQVTGSEP